MLSQTDNEILTRVGPGTLMGNLLRRYWTAGAALGRAAGARLPAGARAAAGRGPHRLPRHVRRRSGWSRNACPHRGASLFFGRNEEDGLRCVYHGWKFDTTGACVDMPSEPAEINFKNKVRVARLPDARVAAASSGPTWGRRRRCRLPRLRHRTPCRAEQWRASQDATRTATGSRRLEGNIDTVAHLLAAPVPSAASTRRTTARDAPGYPTNAHVLVRIWAQDRAPRLEVAGHWYGFRYAGIRTTPNGHTHVRMTRLRHARTRPSSPTCPCGAGGGIFVPIDDEHCWRYSMQHRHAAQPAQRIAGHRRQRDAAQVPLRQRLGAGRRRHRTASSSAAGCRRTTTRSTATSAARHAVTPASRTSSARTSWPPSRMGPIYDRTQEHLGTTDKAIIRMRRMLIKAAQDLAQRHRAAGHGPVAAATTRIVQRREDPRPGRRLAPARHAGRPHGARDGGASARG